MRKEIKRSLKVIGDTIKHPESLGARRREKSAVQIYPSLPSTVETTEEDSTLKWVNNSNKIEAKEKGNTVISMSPPNYEQSEKTRKNIINSDHPGGVDRHPSQDVYRPAPPTYDRDQPDPVAVATGHPQGETLEKGGVPSREETEEEKKERKKQQLERRKVPPEL